MRKYLFLYAVLLTAFVAYTYPSMRSDNCRLKRNQSALSDSVRHYRTRWGEEVASREILELNLREAKRVRKQDTERIRKLGIRLRRVEALSTTTSRQEIHLTAPFFSEHPQRLFTPSDSLHIKSFEWRDSWVKVRGKILGNKVLCDIESVDTLRQIIHRIPHRFLFFRWGTKAIRQEITSSNPHNKIVYTEYIRLRK